MKKSLSCLILALFLSLATGCDDSGGTVASTCGNGRINAGEACDGPELGSATCESLGYRQGQLACTATCELDFADCASWGRCGDGVLQDAVEQCDRFQLGGATCESLGWHGGELACDPQCAYDTHGCDAAGFCGDGTLQGAFEACDGQVPESVTCADVDGYEGAPTCSATCEVDYSTCSGFCGDGVLNPDFESCEPELPLPTCPELAYWTGVPACGFGCHLDENPCAGIADIALSSHAVYVADSAGGGWSWGWADSGLGHTVVQQYPRPVSLRMPGGLGVLDFATSDLHACAIDVHHNAWCWGANSAGQLGNGTTTLSHEPVAVRMPAGVYFEAVTVGYDHSCGLGNNGNIYCWGANSLGQLGNGTTVSAQTPTTVLAAPGLSWVRVVAGFQFTCALGSDSQAWCWGRNDNGQLAQGNTTGRTQPTAVVIPGVTLSDLDCGLSSVCALTSTGTLYCWGRNDSAQLGLGDTTNRLLPALRAEPAGVVLSQVTMGGSHGCAASDDGRLFCWGFNHTGQLGTGTTDASPVPVEITRPENRRVRRLQAGIAATCARLEPALLACWGSNAYGQFGFPSLNVLVPTVVPGPF